MNLRALIATAEMALVAIYFVIMLGNAHAYAGGYELITTYYSKDVAISINTLIANEHDGYAAYSVERGFKLTIDKERVCAEYVVSEDPQKGFKFFASTISRTLKGAPPKKCYPYASNPHAEITIKETDLGTIGRRYAITKKQVA